MNIAEILKYCPKGTKLYSTIFGEVILNKINIHEKYPIVVYRLNHIKTSFTREGYYMEDFPGSECVLFPSKEQRDWNKFRIPFKAGDIVMTVDRETPFIFKEYVGSIYAHCHCGIDLNGTFKTEALYVYWTSNFIIPASEEAKKRLFDKMEEAGYKWNANTLKLEKAVPEFESKFKPFDKVLVKDDLNEEWSINLFSYHDKECQDFPYACINGHYKYCIPYEGNEYFVGKTANIKKI